MNTKFWTILSNTTRKIPTTEHGAPIIMPTRKLAREYANATNASIGSKDYKVVRVGLNLEHRLHDGAWTAIS